MCPISSALDFLGDKWSLLIVRDIMFKHKNTYGEFLASDEKIATNILADRLVQLVAQGILSKSEHPENRVKNVYRLTDKGLDLMPLLMEVIVWSDKYLEISAPGHALAGKIKTDRPGLIQRLTEELGRY